MRGHLVRTLLVGVAVSSVGLVACSSDSETAATTAPAATEPMTTDAVDEPATTNAPATPAELAADGSATITVTVGKDDFDTSGGTRVVSVPKGTAVTITLTDPASDQEYHLHGYDIEVSATKGEPGALSFTADQTGQFDLESHSTDGTLLVLVVI